MLVELPLASFFLSKLLGQKSANVDIDHLQSLDPMLYKNLLYLKNYDGDVQDLGLDFTIGKTIFLFKISPQDGHSTKNQLNLRLSSLIESLG